MAVQLNHTIIKARDAAGSAAFLSQLLGTAPPEHLPPFHEVKLGNGVAMDYMDVDHDVDGQHYAFIVTEPEFDEIFGRIQAQGIEYFADPHAKRPGEINRHDGGRGVYWSDPEGHWLEMITVPYGGWPA